MTLTRLNRIVLQTMIMISALFRAEYSVNCYHHEIFTACFSILTKTLKIESNVNQQETEAFDNPVHFVTCNKKSYQDLL